MHENNVQIVHNDGFFVNVDYDGNTKSIGTVETENHDNVTSEIWRQDGESIDAFCDRGRDFVGRGVYPDTATAEEIVRTQRWIAAKRKARFGIG